MTAQASSIVAAVTAMVVASALLISATTAFAQTDQERPTSSDMEQMHELMLKGNPGMRRMHELMLEATPATSRMRAMMMKQGPAMMDMTSQG